MYVLSVLVKEKNKMKCIATPEPIKPLIANANSNDDDLVKLKKKCKKIETFSESYTSDDKNINYDVISNNKKVYLQSQM